MVKFTQLFAIATLGSSVVSAIHINLRRYHDGSCTESEFVRKETDMHDTTCKSFDPNEFAFNSYKFTVTKDHKDMDKKDCKVTVYKGQECHGESHTFGDLAAMNSQCAVLPAGFNGRSARLECHKKNKIPEPVTVTSLVASKPSTQAKAVTVHEKPTTVTKRPTVIVTDPQTTTKQEETTLTLVPKKHVQHCHYDDDDWKEV